MLGEKATDDERGKERKMLTEKATDDKKYRNVKC